MSFRILLKKAIASLLTVTITALPLHGYAANDPAATGREGQTFGFELSSALENAPGGLSGNTLTVPGIKDGQFQTSGSAQVNINDLYPGTSSSNTAPASDYFPDGSQPNLDKLKWEYESDQGYDQLGSQARTSLWTDANSGTPSIAGAAYKVVWDASNRSRPDFTNDPVLNLTRHTFDNIDVIAEGFGDCSAETVISEGTIDTRVPDYYTCNELYKPKGACTIKHIIEVDVEPSDIVFLLDNSASMGSVIADLRNNVRTFAQLLSQGKSDNLRLGGNTIRYSNYANTKIPLTYDIDAFQGWVNRITTAGAATYPGNAVKWAVNNYNWREGVHRIIILVGNQDAGGDYAGAKAAAAAKGVKVYVFHDNATTITLGHHLANHFSGPRLLKFAQFLTVVTDSWTPESCLNDAIASLEEFCEGTYTPTPANDNGCTNISGFNVCKGDSIYNKIKTPPLPNVPKLASRVDVSKLTCDYNHGKGSCWIDPQGEEQCLENYGDVDQCAKYEADPKCGFISSECIDGATGSRGNCYVYKSIFDCGEDVKIPTLDSDTKYECGGAIACMGNECLDTTRTKSKDFARTAALLNAAQFISQDMDCTDNTGAESFYCTAFAGEPGECKIAVGGIQDCCEKPSNISMRDYLDLIMAVPKLDSAIMKLDPENAVRGGYQVLRDPVMQGWTEVTKPFASHIENISGAWDAFKTGAQEFTDQLLNQLYDEIKQIMMDALKAAGQDLMVEEAAAGAAGKATTNLSQTAATWMGTAMTIYTVYVVTMVMIQIIWACEEDEFKMNAKRALGNCRFVGSYCADEVLGACIEEREAYCCFNSPLSRIIQEQARPQLGMSFGHAEGPECGGIPIEDLGKIDWDKVNLDEWLGILQQNGRFPSAADINMTALTGAGSDFNLGGAGRLNAEERAIKRTDGLDVDQVRRDAADEINIVPDG